MMYPYMTLGDGTEIVHSQIITEEINKTDSDQSTIPVKKVIVHFERPTHDGFDSARCELPSYKWLFCEGFSDKEIEFFDKLLHANAHLLYKYAENGGIKIA